MGATTTACRLAGALLLALVLAVGFGRPAEAAGPDARDGEVIVRLAGTSATRAAAAEGLTLSARQAVGAGEVARVAVAPGSEAETARALGHRPGVLWAAPNVRLRRMAVDPAAEPRRGLQWHLDHVNADRAWAFTRGAASIKVALVDTGIDATHPDRPARLEIGPSFADPALTGDRLGHGTHAAGVLAAPANGLGVVGLAPEVTVQVLKVDDAAGNIYAFDAYRAILWAVDNGARIVNVSLGTAEDSPILREAVDYARGRGVLVVAAAGNAAEQGNPVVFPAALPGVLAVGASTAERRRAVYSETGPYIGLLAPGGDGGNWVFGGVHATATGGGYGSLTGTSAAAPVVSAAAALVWSLDPALSADGVRERLLTNAFDLGAPGRDDATGAGVVDAGAAVASAAAAVPYRAAFRDQACPSIVAGGGRTALRFDVANVGGRVWTRGGPNAVTLATAGPGRASAFHTPGAWPSPTVASALPSEQVPPGTFARFELVLTAPHPAGFYREHFRVVAEGIGTLAELYCDVTVVPSTAWLAADARAISPAVLAPGATGRVVVTVRNVGTGTWRRDGPAPLRLGTDDPRNHDSPLFDRRTWLTPNRPTGVAEAEVPPGAIATFAFNIVAPITEGRLRATFTPVIDGVTWINLPVEVAFDVRR